MKPAQVHKHQFSDSEIYGRELEDHDVVLKRDFYQTVQGQWLQSWSLAGLTAEDAKAAACVSKIVRLEAWPHGYSDLNKPCSVCKKPQLPLGRDIAPAAGGDYCDALCPGRDKVYEYKGLHWKYVKPRGISISLAGHVIAWYSEGDLVSLYVDEENDNRNRIELTVEHLSAILEIISGNLGRC